MSKYLSPRLDAARFGRRRNKPRPGPRVPYVNFEVSLHYRVSKKAGQNRAQSGSNKTKYKEEKTPSVARALFFQFFQLFFAGQTQSSIYPSIPSQIDLPLSSLLAPPTPHYRCTSNKFGKEASS